MVRIRVRKCTLMHHIDSPGFFFCVNGDTFVLVAMDREYDDSDIEMSRPCVFDMNRKVDDLEIPKILINQHQSGGSHMSMKKKIVVACCRDGMKECWEMIRFRHGFGNLCRVFITGVCSPT